jgi:hypothetical protein
MGVERAAAQLILSRAKGVEAERLFKSIRLLDDKLLEAKNQRVSLCERIERNVKSQEIASALRVIRAELEGGECDLGRRDVLLLQGAELQAKAAAILTKLKRERDSTR